MGFILILLVDLRLLDLLIIIIKQLEIGLPFWAVIGMLV